MDSTALVDTFLAEARTLTATLPFAFLTDADTPLDPLDLPALVYLRWAASRDFLIDTELSRKILESRLPVHALPHVRAAFGNAIHLHSLAPAIRAFTSAYYCTGAHVYFLKDFFCWFPQVDERAARVSWEILSTAPGLLDERLGDWRKGDSWKITPEHSDAGNTPLVDTSMGAVPLLPDAWIDQLARLSRNVRDHPSSVAYAQHFSRASVESPTDAMLQAAFREFCRSPQHDTSMLQSAVNFLGAAPLTQYARVYAKVLPEMLAANPDAALSLFNYPGAHLSPEQTDQMIDEIVSTYPHGNALASLAGIAVEMNAADDDPFNALVTAAGARRDP